MDNDTTWEYLKHGEMTDCPSKKDPGENAHFPQLDIGCSLGPHLASWGGGIRVECHIYQTPCFVISRSFVVGEGRTASSSAGWDFVQSQGLISENMGTS